jgi:predicted nucleic acid-binding protein
MNIVDSSAWLEYFIDGPNADFFSPPIEDVRNLIVPTISLYEVFKKVLAENDEAEAFKAIAQMKQGHVVELDEDTALSAARISIENKIPMADSIILATAKSHKATLWTQDEHFKEMTGVKFRQKRI